MGFNQIALRNKVERGNLTTTDTTAVDGQRSTSISPCFLLCNRRGLMIGPYCCGWWNYSWLILITIFISIIKDKEQGMGNSLLFTYYVVEWGRMSGSYCCGWWNNSWLILITIFISIIKDRQTAGNGKNRKCRTWKSIKEEMYVQLCTINVNKAR